jgi:hypothetical protein
MQTGTDQTSVGFRTPRRHNVTLRGLQLILVPFGINHSIRPSETHPAGQKETKKMRGVHCCLTLRCWDPTADMRTRYACCLPHRVAIKTSPELDETIQSGWYNVHT